MQIWPSLGRSGHDESSDRVDDEKCCESRSNGGFLPEPTQYLPGWHYTVHDVRASDGRLGTHARGRQFTQYVMI